MNELSDEQLQSDLLIDPDAPWSMMLNNTKRQAVMSVPVFLDFAEGRGFEPGSAEAVMDRFIVIRGGMRQSAIRPKMLMSNLFKRLQGQSPQTADVWLVPIERVADVLPPSRLELRGPRP